MTYNSLEKDGQTLTQGGYSDKIVVDENYVLRLPDNISPDRAAPLLCAGITMYSPLVHWSCKESRHNWFRRPWPYGSKNSACIRL